MIKKGYATPPSLVTLGETLVALVAEQSGPLGETRTFSSHIAGAESNVAIGSVRLGVAATYVGRVGNDEMGRAVLRRLRGEGVDVSNTVVDEMSPTGLLMRNRADMSKAEVFYYRRDSAGSRLEPADLDEDVIKRADLLHISGVTPALSRSCRETVFAAVEIARDASVTVSLDPNIRRKLWSVEEATATIRELARRADLVFPSAVEAALITGESDCERSAKDILAMGPTTVVVTLGQRGAFALSSESIDKVNGIDVGQPLDVVGAGDAFAAGFLAARLRGLAISEALEVANRCGAMVTLVVGDTEGLPYWNDVSGPDDSHETDR